MDLDGDEDDGEWEYEETEELVTLDLGPESKRLLQMSHQYTITGLEGKHPFLRLGNVVFRGQWDELLGTEIILCDEKDTSKPVLHQHNIRPLPPSPTDIRTGRPPSTTRHRIQFRPAANMAARELALRDPANPSLMQPVSHKNAWVWIKGSGWIRREDVVVSHRGTSDGPSTQQQAPGQEAVVPAKKAGRKKLTTEEKMRFSIWRSLQKIDRARAGEGTEGGDDDVAGEEDEDGEGQGDEDGEEASEESAKEGDGSEDDDGSQVQHDGVS